MVFRTDKQEDTHKHTHTGHELKIRYSSPASILMVIWKTHEKCSCEQRSEGLSPYGNVNNLRLSGVKSYMGMLGMLKAEFLAITDIMIWKLSIKEKLFLFLLLLIWCLLSNLISMLLWWVHCYLPVSGVNLVCDVRVWVCTMFVQEYVNLWWNPNLQTSNPPRPSRFKHALFYYV